MDTREDAGVGLGRLYEDVVERGARPEDGLLVLVQMPAEGERLSDGSKMIVSTAQVGGQPQFVLLFVGMAMIDNLDEDVDHVIAVMFNLPPDVTEQYAGAFLSGREFGFGVSAYAVRDKAWCCMAPDDECGCEVSAGELVLS